MIAVNHGPGSFTGLRSAVAAARGLALAAGLPVLAVGSLEALAAAVPSYASGTLVAAMDARRGQVYAQAFDHRRPAAVRTARRHSGAGGRRSARADRSVLSAAVRRSIRAALPERGAGGGRDGRTGRALGRAACRAQRLGGR